jgi:TM2 domain-containing membrane protein YozV
MTTGRAIRAEVEHYRRFSTSAAKRIQGKTSALHRLFADTACFHANRLPNFMSSARTPHKNNTAATLLALVLGWGGIHRAYLRGPGDRWALLHLASVPVSALVLFLAPQANVFYQLLPMIVSYIAGLVEGLVIGLTPDEKFDARYNAGSGGRSDSNWPLALILVVMMLVGTTTLIATISRLFDLLYTGGAYG